MRTVVRDIGRRGRGGRPTGIVSALLLSMLLTPEAGAIEPHIPEIAGTTTITFEGASAIRLRVPEDVSLTQRDFEFTLEGKAAFGHLGPVDHPCRAGFPSDTSDPPWCTDYGFRLMKDWVMSPNTIAPNVDTLRAGRADMYMVTDGRVTVTFRVPELDGEVSYEATGLVDGAIAEHPVECAAEALTGCDRQGWGGQQFASVSPPAIVGTMAFAQRPNNLPPTNDPSPGTVGVGSCIYPDDYNPGKSSDPDDHPRGCDPDDNAPINFPSSYVSSSVNPLVVSWAHKRATLALTPGPFYTGFAAHAIESAEEFEGPGRFGSFAYWYSREIRCPSGDWSDC